MLTVNKVTSVASRLIIRKRLSIEYDEGVFGTKVDVYLLSFSIAFNFETSFDSNSS